MKKTFQIISEEVRDRAASFIAALSDFKKPVEVTVKTAVETRSLRQNRLYWRWIGAITDQTGMHRAEIHEDFKRRLLHPIIIETDPDYNEMVSAVRYFARKDKKRAEVIGKQVIKMLSTTRIDVEQMNFYMREVDGYCLSNGISLPLDRQTYES